MYTYDIRSVVGVYTPVGVATEWLWSVHSKLECTLRQGKGYDRYFEVHVNYITGSHIFMGFYAANDENSLKCRLVAIL